MGVHAGPSFYSIIYSSLHHFIHSHSDPVADGHMHTGSGLLPHPLLPAFIPASHRSLNLIPLGDLEVLTYRTIVASPSFPASIYHFLPQRVFRYLCDRLFLNVCHPSLHPSIPPSPYPSPCMFSLPDTETDGAQRQLDQRQQEDGEKREGERGGEQGGMG